MDLVKKIIKGDRAALARAISLVENCSNETNSFLEKIIPLVGRAFRIGVTGPPGVGKSTLTNELTALIRKKNHQVGIIAVDPSSIFTGGAILGDRIRMQPIGLDEGVFIRSMATRGCLGGLADATTAAADILDAAGKKYVIVETVGVGQSEVEIFKMVDITLVVLSPESGDSIQTMKSGLMEIADVIVVNKSDRPGADILINSLRSTAELSEKTKDTPIFKTVAQQGEGVSELFEYLEKKFSGSGQSEAFQQKRKFLFEERLRSLVVRRIEADLWSNKKIQNLLKEAGRKMGQADNQPVKVVDKIIKLFKQNKK
ncbi:MAG: methylmalonyl Co-A mutase-associated GTPase MeaB [Planctomycetes bacterium]|nr:methylmalonyl Co-A mutase-associated GTPase MeaB [Planctomycetota bacterium]